MISIHEDTVFQRIIILLRNEWPAETSGLDLQPSTPIFYDGIGLDSVDGATLLLALEEEFDLEIDNLALGQQHFETIGRLTEFISQLLAA